ncbi:MAG: hypothetical protein ACK6D7_19495, partial [Acidobacteriota bacterium]
GGVRAVWSAARMAGACAAGGAAQSVRPLAALDLRPQLPRGDATYLWAGAGGWVVDARLPGAGADPAGPPPTHVGIRARHLRLRVEGGGRINVFPCRLRALTESPHEVTLGLAVGESGAATLAMQMSREEWRIWRTRPPPWYVELPPEQLLWLVG